MTPFQDNSPSRLPLASPLRQTVLVVDDDAKDLSCFASQLDRMGYAVEAVASHREAEAHLGRRHFDLLLLSLGGAILEGHRLLRLTLGRDKRTPVLVLARYLEIQYYIEAMQLGAADYLEKPLSPAQLERLVAKHGRPRQDEFSALQS